jgi:hypothetical protein
MLFSQHAGQAAFTDQLLHQLRRKTVRLVGEIPPVEPDGHAGNFPVAAQRVLAFADFFGARIGTLYAAPVQRIRLHRLPRQGMGQTGSHRQGMGFFQSQGRQMRQVQILRFAVGTFAVLRHPRGNMSQRIGAAVAERLGIVRIADAE